MSNKGKSDKKDIDDVLSSIDSLLDTATDVEADDLPILQPEKESVETLGKTKKPTSSKKPAVNKKKLTQKTVAKSNKSSKKQQTNKTQSVSSTSEKSKRNQSVANKSISEDKPISDLKEDSKPEVKKQANPKEKQAQASIKLEKPSTGKTDFSLTQKQLPVLDEIITEEEMALIAAGKELPKRVITEKFVPKTTTDKIIDLLAIQLADYNITRLEYEYLHELIDEILNEESQKKNK